MSNTSPHHKSQPAYLEDYSEDTNTVLPGTRQTANIAAKRSKPDIQNKFIVAEKGRDEASDSGYSSQTGATVATRGSTSQESKTKQLPLSPLQKRSARKRTSIGAEMAPPSRKGSPEKPALQRNISRTQGKENLRYESVESRESAARMRTSGEPVETPPAPRQPRLRHTGPPSPQSTRAPWSGAQEDPIIRPAQARPRPTPTHAQYSRPLSYHAGTMSESMLMQGPATYTHRPEPLYVQTFSYQGPPPPGVPPQAPPIAYLPTPLQTSPQRQAAYPFPPTTFAPPYQPPPGHWVEPVRSSSRRSSMYSARPLVEYSPVQQIATPVYGPAVPLGRRTSIHRVERISPITPIEESYFIDEHPDESYYRDLRAMPPPPVPTLSHRQPQQRPNLRHAATTSTAHPPLQHRRSNRDTEASYETALRKLSLDETRPPSRPASRPTMSSRPSATSSVNINYSTHNNTVSPNDDRVPLSRTNSRHGRRPVSYYGPEEREREAEAHIEAQNSGIKPIPLTAEKINKVVRRRSKTSGGSGSGSRAGSSREGSDVKMTKTTSRSSIEKSRRGTGGSEVKIRQEEGAGLSLTISNAHQGMSLGLKGDGVDGRTISIRPGQTRDGQVEVRIGGRSTVASRDGRTRETSSRRYSYAGSSRAVKEVAQVEYGSRRRSRSRATGEGAVESDKGKEKERTGESGDVLERLRREKPSGSRSRRSSRSGVSRRGVVEGQPF